MIPAAESLVLNPFGVTGGRCLGDAHLLPSGKVRDTPTLMLLRPQDEIASSLTALALASSPGRQSCVTCSGQQDPPMGLQMVHSCSLGSPESLESSSYHCSWATARLSSIVLISSEGSSCPAACVPPRPPSMPLALVGGSWLSRARCSLPIVGLQTFLPQAEGCFSRENVEVTLNRQS